jgi:hypothetical protein
MPEITETTLDRRFSSPDATPTPWEDARMQLEEAQDYWLSTVRRDGRPHVTTVAAVWVDDAVYVTTGESEQKAKNLEHNTNVVITTGCNMNEGLDVVVEAEALRETDPAKLQQMADAYRAKYGPTYPYTVRDGVLVLDDAPGDVVVAFRLRAHKAFGIGKGESFSQTRWRF